MWVKSSHTIMAGYGLLIIAALGVLIAYVTGEGAEDMVVEIAGVSKHSIEQHADFALYPLIALILAGVSAIVGLFFTIRKSSQAGISATITLCIAMVGFGLAARTGYQGGQIRHTETQEASPARARTPEKIDKD
jgi:hypothetical protein